jgi:hypothetical protein
MKRTLILAAVSAVALSANVARADSNTDIDPYWKTPQIVAAQGDRAVADATTRAAANSSEERNRVLQGYNP